MPLKIVYNYQRVVDFWISVVQTGGLEEYKAVYHERISFFTFISLRL